MKYLMMPSFFQTGGRGGDTAWSQKNEPRVVSQKQPELEPGFATSVMN